MLCVLGQVRVDSAIGRSLPPPPIFISQIKYFPCAGSRVLSFNTTTMAAYPRLDPYKSSRYDQGIDAKIVVMGNTGAHWAT